MPGKESCNNRIDLVFDVYKQKSIKTAERRNKGESISFLFCEDNKLWFLYENKFLKTNFLQTRFDFEILKTFFNTIINQ